MPSIRELAAQLNKMDRTDLPAGLRLAPAEVAIGIVAPDAERQDEAQDAGDWYLAGHGWLYFRSSGHDDGWTYAAED